MDVRCDRIPGFVLRRLDVLTDPNLSTREMAERLGLSIETVRSYRRVIVKCGLDKPRRRGPYVPPARVERLLELLGAGYSCADAARGAGVSYKFAYRVCRELGVVKQRPRRLPDAELEEILRKMLSERGVVEYGELVRLAPAESRRIRVALLRIGARFLKVARGRRSGRGVRLAGVFGDLLCKTLVWLDAEKLGEFLRERLRGDICEPRVRRALSIWLGYRLPREAAERVRRVLFRGCPPTC